MKSYRQFKNLKEDTGDVLKTIETSVLPALYKQIDALFDELGRQIRNIKTPRSNWLGGVKNWFSNKFGGQKTESFSLHDYHSFQKYIKDFQKALNEDANWETEANNLWNQYGKKDEIDQILSQFKDRLKGLVKNTLSPEKAPNLTQSPQNVGWKPGSGERPVDVAGPNGNSRFQFSNLTGGDDWNISRPGQKVEPEPVQKVEPEPTPEPQKVEPEPVQKIEPKIEPEPVQKLEPKVEPTPEPVQASEPAAVTPPKRRGRPKKQAIDPEQEKMIRLGMAIRLAKDSMDSEDPEHVEYFKDQVNAIDLKDQLPEDLQAWAKIGQEYMQKQNDTNVGNGPIGTAPIEEDLPEPTKEELMQMPWREFKKFIEKKDEELAGAYSGQHWWKPNMRKELVTAYLQQKEFLKKHESSLQSILLKYKNMLRNVDRPLLEQNTLSGKIAFYKRKLSSHGK